MTAEPVPADEVTILLDGARTTALPVAGETLLETARRAA